MANGVERLKKVEKKETKETLPICTAIKPKIVNQYIGMKSQIEEIQEDFNKLNYEISDIGRVFLNTLQEKGEFSKSCRANGDEDTSLRVVFSDKFTVNQDQIDNLKKTLGNDYDKVIEEKRVVALKAEVFKDESILEKVLKKFSDQELKEYFDITIKYSTKKGFDQTRYELTESKREKVETFIVQAKASVIIE